jgi:hypothetical protein
LFFRITAEKEQLACDHRKALDAQEKISAELKDKLMEAELRHSRELKDAQAASEVKLDESLKDFSDANTQLRKELEEESRLLKEAQAQNAQLAADQLEFDRLIIQDDTLALSKSLFFFSFVFKLIFSGSMSYADSLLLFFFPSRSFSGFPVVRAQEGDGAQG